MLGGGEGGGVKEWRRAGVLFEGIGEDSEERRVIGVTKATLRT